MTNKIVTPSARDLDGFPPALKRWVQEVSKAINGGTEGADVVTSTKTQSDGIVSGSQAIVVNDSNIGIVSAALEAVSANAAQAQATATAVAGGSTSTLGGACSPVFATGGTSKQVTFTATGGTTPYTSYAWVKISGSADITIDNAAIANPTFSSAQSGERSATWRCTVTDTAVDTFSADCSITLLGSGISE